MNPYSPNLALLTGFVELFAFVYFFLLFKNSESRLKSLTAILFFLAGYQLFEAYNCLFPGHEFAVRLSFVDITVLPALGVYFAYLNAPVESKWQRAITFVFLGTGLFFVTYFLSKPSSVYLKSCQYFFATYTHPDGVFKYYGLYYQAGMFAMLMMGIRNMIYTSNLMQRKLMGDFLMGSMMFVIPSILITAFVTPYQGSMPSVMCHIALFLSLFIIRGLLREKKVRELSLSLQIAHVKIRL